MSSSNSPHIALASALLFLALFAGCMGPDVEFVPATIEIYGAQVSEITSTTAVVTWNTTSETYARLQIIRQEDITNTILDPKLSRSHRIELEGLSPSTYYMLVIQTTNGLGAGSIETGKDLVFQTAAD